MTFYISAQSSSVFYWTVQKCKKTAIKKLKT